MANQNARQDDNLFPAMIAHAGTAGTAETIKVVANSSGALTVDIGGTEPFELVAGTVTRVSNIGTLEVGTVSVGSIANIGVVHNAGTIASLPQVSVGTLPTLNLTTGTLNAGTTTETRPATATLANIVGTNVNITLLASNTARRAAYFYNEGTAVCSLKLGTTATAGSFTVQMVGTSFYELPTPVYSGIVDGIWAASTGTMHVTEIT